MRPGSQSLLADYAESGSEEAFRTLVAAYLDLVYSTAARLTGGDTHLAEDVAQTVFIDLARLAKILSREVRLGGWLHRHTCFIAAKALRAERRRQTRERQAMEMNELTDHAQARLADHQGQSPTSRDQLTTYLRESIPLSGTNQFEIIFHGSLDSLNGLPWGSVAVIRETQPWPNANGKMSRVYGFPDGHAQIVSLKYEQSWEAQHVIQSQAQPSGQ